jgi:hypothetical protein
MDIELTTSLVTCPECHIIFQYYDFLSHNEICYYTNYESTHETTNETMELDIASNLEPNITMPIHTSTYTYNGLNNYGNYGNTNNLNLYNPMINRGLHNNNSYDNNDNDNNGDSDDAIYTLHNYLLSLNINTSSNTTINYGLNKKELENNSKIIECNDSTDCHICLCNYPKTTHFYLMNCNHSFCIECSERWFSKNSVCPLCRKNYK